MIMWRTTAAMLAATAAASLLGAQALQRPVDEVGDEVLTRASVCARAARTGWFPVIVPGCKEALASEGFGTYDVPGAFRHADCYSAPVEVINDLMEGSEMKIDFPDKDKTMYVRLVDEDLNLRNFSNVSHIFQWKWDALGDYLGPCGHESQNEEYYWLFSKSSNYALENCESGNYESGINANGFFSNDWNTDTSFWADTIGWDSDVVISINVEDYCADEVVFTYEAQEVGFCGDDDTNRLCSVEYNGGLLPANDTTCLHVEGHYQGGSWVVDSESGEWTLDDCDLRCTELICAADIMCGGYTYFKETGVVRLASVIDYTEAAGGTYCMQKIGSPTLLIGDGGGCRLNDTYASLDARDFDDYPGLVKTDAQGLPNVDACNNLCFTYAWCKSFAFSEDLSKCLLYDWVPEALSTIRSENSYSCYTYSEYVPEATLPPAAKTCQDDIDGGGWSLVRRVKQGRKWHPATDHLTGTAVYGTFVNDGSVGETFSRYYASELEGDTEFLFSSGDCYYWLISDETNVVYRRGAPFMANILAASDIQKEHEVLWYHRSTHAEDPWISLQDHEDSIYSATVLYGENDWYGDSRDTLLADHNGANVYIRPGKRTPAPGTDELEIPAPYGTRALSPPAPAQAKPQYQLPAPQGGKTSCCAVFLGPNSGNTGEYEVRVDVDGAPPGQEHVAASLQHKAKAGKYVMRAQVYRTDDWDGSSNLLHSRVFGTDNAAIASTNGPAVAASNHWEYYEATLDTGSKVPGWFSIYLGFPMENEDGYTYISQLTLTDEDGFQWVPNNGDADCELGIIEGVAGNNTIDSRGNIGVTEVPCDFDVIPAPEVVTDLCEVRHGPWAGGSPTDAYCSWYEVRADVMCRDKIWLGKGKTLPECWQAIEEDDRCSDTMYGDGSTSCACVPKDGVCTYAVSTVGNAVYERCCEVRTVAASCWNNCGRYTPDRSCFCTHDCAAVGDCCDDFQELCCAPAPEHAGAIDLDAPAPDTDDTAPAQMLLAPRASPTPSPIIEVDQTTKFSAQLANPSPAAQTCKGNCQWPWTGGSNTATASCYCDKDCDAYNDCCDDKPTWCRNGCTNQACRNYDPAALVDDGGCYQCDQKTIPAPKIPDRTPSPINPSPSSVFPAPANRTPSPTPAPGRRQQDWPFDWKPAPDKQANQHNDADATMTCVGNCYAPWHSDSKQACWCDESCDKFEDCCDDKEDACPSTPAQNPAPHPGPHGANVVPSPTPGPDTDANNYTDHHPSPTPAPQKDSAGDIAEMPAPFGTDPVTSCEGYCDYPYHSSIPNSCWCDVYCIEHGDCCDDREICISDCEKEITAIYERVLCRKPDTEEIVDLLDACIAPGENVAATKADCRPSSVASTDNKCEAALDGKRNTAFRTKSATPNPVTACDVDAEEDPFLEFDMSVENGIGVVTIKNVLDSCASRLFAHSGKCEWSMDANKYDAFNEGAVVGISQNPCEVGKGCQGIICDKLDTPNEYGNYEVDCGGQFGRYVWIYLPGACRVLSLAEITVEVPDTGIGMWYKEQFNENGIEGFCEDHTTNYLCANGVYEYLNGGFAPTNSDTCDLANAVGVWDSFSCGNECAQELCSVDGNCNGYVWEKSGNIRLVNRVAGVGKQEGSHCYKQSNALGNKGKKTFPLIEYELLNSEEYEDCDWCQAQCDADPQDCVGAWGEWGDCSASCGEGTATRYFLITQQAYSGGDECEYKKYTEETTDCETGVLVDGELKCPLDCEGDWDDWTECSVSCGGGTQSRMFNVTVAADYGGNSCEDIFDLDVEDVGDTATETATCADTYCPSDCSGEWSDYSVCPVTCGAEDNLFTSTRTYEILIPARLGGEECPEFDGVVESGTGLCNTNQCAIDITIWVDEDLNEYLINDAKSEWVTDDGYVEGTIDFYDEDPAILYNGDGDVVAAVHMVQVTENEVDTHGLRVAVDDNEEELDAIYAEFDNTMELDDSNVLAGLHNVILGGYSNDLEPDTEYCSIGAGKHNQALDKSSYAAMGGGLNNIINANYASVLGGWKNKCYSNYCVVVGGFLNQVSARFGTVLGGAKNTVAGRFGVAAGYQATTRGDWSATFAFNNSACVNEDDSTVKFCANSFVVNDFDVVDLFPADSRRALRGEGEHSGGDDGDAKRLRGSETDRDDDDDELDRDDDDDELEVAERAAECADRLDTAVEVNRRLKQLLATLDAL